MTEHYAAAEPLMGTFAHSAAAAAPALAGRLLADQDWLAERVADTGARWSTDDARVNGTLWWYSASAVLVAGPLAMLASTGRAPDVELDQLRIALRPNGYLATTRSLRLLPAAPAAESAAALSAALSATCAQIIEPLAAVSGAGVRALWAIASDSVGSRAVGAGVPPAAVPATCAAAASLALPPLLSPRYVDVDGAGSRPADLAAPPAADARRFLRRSSCCLIYEAPGEGKCRGCPRQKPVERLARQRALLAEQP